MWHDLFIAFILSLVLSTFLAFVGYKIAIVQINQSEPVRTTFCEQIYI